MTTVGIVSGIILFLPIVLGLIGIAILSAKQKKRKDTIIHQLEEEAVDINKLSNDLEEYISKVSSKELQRVLITECNKDKAVIISCEEYEKLKELEDFIDDIAIAQIIKERVLDKKEPVKMLNKEDMDEFIKIIKSKKLEESNKNIDSVHQKDI